MQGMVLACLLLSKIRTMIRCNSCSYVYMVWMNGDWTRTGFFCSISRLYFGMVMCKYTAIILPQSIYSVYHPHPTNIILTIAKKRGRFLYPCGKASNQQLIFFFMLKCYVELLTSSRRHMPDVSFKRVRRGRVGLPCPI